MEGRNSLGYARLGESEENAKNTEEEATVEWLRGIHAETERQCSVYKNVLKMCYNVNFVYLNRLQNTLKQNIIATIAVTCYVQRYKDGWHTIYIAWVKLSL